MNEKDYKMFSEALISEDFQISTWQLQELIQLFEKNDPAFQRDRFFKELFRGPKKEKTTLRLV
jgi:hypothetical protein|tara:strand:- start:2423 stop:2611 length:189 start_codon:yes stop_codon:yes gene_type:complete